MKNQKLFITLVLALSFTTPSAKAEDTEFGREVRRVANISGAYWGQGKLAGTAQGNFRECVDFKQCFEEDCKKGNADGLKPAARPFVMKAKAPVKGTIMMVHGLADSPYTMGLTAEKMRDDGYNVVSILLSGHGRPGSSKREVGAWKRDVEKGVKLAKKFFPEGPLYGMGYSTGGGVLTRVVQEGKVKVDGMILADAALELPLEARSFEANVARCAIKFPAGFARLILQTGMVDKLPVKFVKENAENIKALLKARETLRSAKKLDSDNGDDMIDPSRGAVQPEDFYEVRTLTDEINGREKLTCGDKRDQGETPRKTNPVKVNVPTLALFTDSTDTVDTEAGQAWVQQNVTAEKKVKVLSGVTHRGLLIGYNHDGCRLKERRKHRNDRFDEVPESISAFLNSLQKPASVGDESGLESSGGTKDAR